MTTEDEELPVTRATIRDLQEQLDQFGKLIDGLNTNVEGLIDIIKVLNETNKTSIGITTTQAETVKLFFDRIRKSEDGNKRTPNFRSILHSFGIYPKSEVSSETLRPDRPIDTTDRPTRDG